jgi:predicted PurR-regulated permease PerM
MLKITLALGGLALLLVAIIALLYRKLQRLESSLTEAYINVEALNKQLHDIYKRMDINEEFNNKAISNTISNALDGMPSRK